MSNKLARKHYEAEKEAGAAFVKVFGLLAYMDSIAFRVAMESVPPHVRKWNLPRPTPV